MKTNFPISYNFFVINKKLLLTLVLLFSVSVFWGQWTTVQTNNFNNFPTGFAQSGFSNEGYGAESGGSDDKCAYDKNVGTSPTSYVSIQATLDSGYTYRFSYYAKRAQSASCGVTFKYSNTDDNGGTNVSAEFTPPKRSGSEAGDNFISNEISGDGNTYYLKAVVTTGNSSDVKLRIDGFKLERKASGPILTVSPSSLTGFTYVEGNGPSTSQSFTLSGSNLDGSDVTLSAPTDYEISEDDTTFVSSITLGSYDGSDKIIYVHLKVGLSAGDYNSETISISGGGDTDGESLTCDGTVDAAVKAISIEGNGTVIPDADTTPSVSDDTDFGDVEVPGGSQLHHFTIKNTGNTTLTINSVSSDNTEFAISDISTPIDIEVNNSTTFDVTFSPTATGSRTATLTIASNADDTDEANYDFLVQGNGTNSASSNIITNTGFTYTVNIPYLDYQDNPITNTSGSVGVFKFDIQDGGGSADADALSTELTDITFSVGATHGNYILAAALFDGNTHKANSSSIDTGTGTITFSGLSGADYTAVDDGIRSLTLRVSFSNSVADNEQLQFVITSATANSSGSVFATADAGGAQSDITGDKNRIEVVADRIQFNTQPQNQTKNTNLQTFSIIAIDVNNIKDLDATNDISLSTSASGIMTHNSPYTMVSGEIDISDVQFDTPQTGITITATTTGLAVSNDVTSETFDILDLAEGSYRTKTAGTWNSTNGNSTSSWQEFTSGSWTDMAESPDTDTSNAVYIFHQISLAGTFSASDVTIESGGELNTSTVGATFTDLLVKSGGTFIKEANGVKINGTVEVESGGTFKFSHTNGTSLSTNLWKGTEKFHTDSNFVVLESDTNVDYMFMEAPDDVSDFNGGQFGNIIIDANDKLMLLPDNYNGTLTKGDLIFKNLSDNIKFTQTDATCTIKGNIEIQSTVGYDITITTKEKTVTLTVNGDFIHNGTEDFRLANSNGIDPNITMNIDGDLTLGGSTSKFRPDISSNGTGTNEINLKGDLAVNSGSILYSENTNSALNFVGTGDGTTDATTQTINIASTDTNENKSIQFNVNSGAYVQIVNQNFELGKNSKLTVKDGAIFDFGFDGLTPLLVTISGNQTGTAFDLDAGGYLKITSPDGIMSDSSAGNVQVVASNTTFSTLATFHYIGKADQVTGDAIGSSSNGRAIIVEMENNTLSLTPSQSFGITDASNTNINGGNGGILDIRKGKFTETTDEYITGSTGGLTMADGTLYQIPRLSADTTDKIPRLEGLSNTYNLSGSSTIQLNGGGDQIARGSRVYRNLTFSSSGTKTISDAITSITGEITVENSAILDVENKTMGGAGTDLSMYNTAQYITAGTGTKPDAQGMYLLDTDTKIVFNNNQTALQSVRLTPEYANIDIDGTSVGTASLGTGIDISGTFTVKDGATFKHINTAGFNGANNTAVDNTNIPTITLETGSTIEYNGADQTITQPSLGYQNLTISGTDIKTVGAIVIDVNENMTVSSEVLIGTDNSMVIDGNIDNSGVIEVQNEASLVQTATGGDANTNNGTYKIHKTTPAYINYDYIYWSSPVSDITFGEVFSANPDRRYALDPTKFLDLHSGSYEQTTGDPDAFDDNGDDWVYQELDDSMVPGVGYIIMGAGSPIPFDASAVGSPSSGSPQSVVFEKDVINNGDIDVTVYKDKYHIDDLNDGSSIDDYHTNANLIGNPYPSAIDIKALYNGNTGVLTGTFYFWTHDVGIANNDGPNAYDFTNDSYATVTYDGTDLGYVASDTGANGPEFIASGQSFIANIKDDINDSGADLTFTNAMRVVGDNDSFTKSTNNVSDKIWLNMTKGASLFRQLLVVFRNTASDEYMEGQDAPRMENGNNADFYSVIPNNEARFAIQSLATFNEEKTVPLGIEIVEAGTYEINIDHMEGVFTEGQDVYLEDTQLGIIHDFANGPYVFTSDVVDNDVRFTLRFTSSALSLDENVLEGLVVYPNPSNGMFTISFANAADSSIQVYDITGKVIKTTQGAQIDMTDFSKGVYYAKISIDGQQTVKKLVLK